MLHTRPELSGVVTDILSKPDPKIPTDYFACSETAAYWIFPNASNDNGIVKVIKNRVNPKRFSYDVKKATEIGKENGFAGKFGSGNVARFKAEKNHTCMIEVLEQIFKIKSDVMFTLWRWQVKTRD